MTEHEKLEIEQGEVPSQKDAASSEAAARGYSKELTKAIREAYFLYGWPDRLFLPERR